MRIWLAMTLLIAAVAAHATEPQLESQRAQESATLWPDFSTNDDIVKEDYVGFLQVVDMDQDGVDEIVHLSLSYCAAYS